MLTKRKIDDKVIFDMTFENATAASQDVEAEFDGIVANLDQTTFEPGIVSDTASANRAKALGDEAIRVRSELTSLASADELEMLLALPTFEPAHEVAAREEEIAQLEQNFASPAAGKAQAETKSVLATKAEATSGKAGSKPETQSAKRSERVKKMLGRVAMAPIKAVKTADKWLTIGAVTAISKMPGAATKEEIFERDRQLKERFADKDDDSWLRKRYNALRRNQNKIASYVPVAMMGAIALERIGAPLLHNVSLFEHHSAVDPTAVLKHYDVKQTALTTNYVFGGRGDSTSEGAAGAVLGRGDGSDVVPVPYNAGIAPLDPGPSLDASTAEGASNATAQIQEQLAQDPNAQITVEGFSEGSIAAAKTAMDLARANGGALPPNVHLILDGSPVSNQGFWASDTAKGVSPFLKLAGIDPSVVPLPAGTEVRTSQNDLWGNGKQSLVVNGLQAMDLPNAHVVEDPNAPHITWTDSNGVIHEEYDVGIHPITQMLSPSDPSRVPSGFNDMFNAALPVNTNMDPNAPPPQPNAIEAENGFAKGVDQAAGGFPIGDMLIKAIPPQGTGVLQDSLNLVNNDGSKLMDIGQNPQNAPQDIQAVMGDVNHTMTDVSNALNSLNNGNGGNIIQNTINSVAGGNVLPAMPAQPVAPAVPVQQIIPQIQHILAPAGPNAAPAANPIQNFQAPLQQGLNFFGGAMRNFGAKR